MSTEENKDLVLRWIEAQNKTDLQGALACWTDNNREWLGAAFNRFTAAFPDIHLAINEMVAEGDKVVVLWTLTGTHRGDWRGIPGTGKAVTWNATDTYAIKDGRIASLARAADSLVLLKQLGATTTWQGAAIE
jgi:steroid delta-isomerase-like uncharacterized protein